MLNLLGIFGGVAILTGMRIWGRRRAQAKLTKRMLLALESKEGESMDSLLHRNVDSGKGYVLLTAAVLSVAIILLPFDIGVKTIGCLITILFGTYNALEKDSEWNYVKKLGAAAQALEHLKLEGKPEHIEMMFERLLLQKMNPEYVSVGMNALEEWKPSQLPIELEGYEDDELLEFDSRIRSLNSTSKKLVRRMKLNKLSTVNDLLNDSHYWSRINREIQSGENFNSSWKVDEEHLQVVDFLVRNQEFLQGIYRVICTRCMARTEVSGPHRLVRCRSCQEADELIGQVRVLKGEIGGETEGMLKSGEFIVQLWDEQAQEARSAEVGVLEIIADAAINYDWATSACLETLSNAFPNVDLRPELVVQPGVELSGNTLLQLEAFHGKRNLALRPGSS